MIRNNICIYDFETGSKYPYSTQPIQLAACIVDIQKLEIMEGSLFKSLMRPIFDEAECKKLGIDPLQDEALNVNHITVEELEKAPDSKLVWQNFVEYTKKYNITGQKGKQWDAVACGGYNNVNFDDIIMRRLCDQYGPKLDDYGKCPIFHPFLNFDVQADVVRWFNYASVTSSNSASLDAVRDYMGIDKENAHDALKDVIDSAHLLIKFLRLERTIYLGQLNLAKGQRIKFKDCFLLGKENQLTKKLIEEFEK